MEPQKILLRRSMEVDVTKGSPYTDFSRGFYTTTLRRQAESWACERSKLAKIPSPPAVVAITVPREDLAQLETLYFVRGNFDAEDFWSFVWHCRQGNLGHARHKGQMMLLWARWQHSGRSVWQSMMRIRLAFTLSEPKAS